MTQQDRLNPLPSTTAINLRSPLQVADAAAARCAITPGAVLFVRHGRTDDPGDTMPYPRLAAGSTASTAGGDRCRSSGTSKRRYVAAVQRELEGGSEATRSKELTSQTVGDYDANAPIERHSARAEVRQNGIRIRVTVTNTQMSSCQQYRDGIRFGRVDRMWRGERGAISQIAEVRPGGASAPVADIRDFVTAPSRESLSRPTAR